ncbi:MAG: alpha/beta hydrolase [Thermoanaerobaculia bacterium]
MVQQEYSSSILLSIDEMEPPRRPRRVLRYALPPLALVGGLGALELLRQRYQARRVFRPERFPQGEWTPEKLGLPIEDLWFEAEDGVRLHGWWISHPEAEGTLLYCHGQTGSIAHRVDLLKKLAGYRANIFAFDYRGYGRSRGAPSEKGLFRDVRAAHDVITGELGQSSERIVLIGQSLGGAVAIDGALNRPVAGLVVQSSFLDIKSMARSSHPRLPVHWIARNQFKSADKVPHLAMPKLFIHGTADRVVPFHHGRGLFEKAAWPKQFYAVPGAGHTDVLDRGGVTYFWRLSRFLLSCVKPHAGPEEA